MYEISRMGKFKRQKGDERWPGAERRVNRELLLMVTEILFGMTKKVSEIAVMVAQHCERN